MNNLKLALDITKRIVKPCISRLNVAVTFKCNYNCVTCNMAETHRRNPAEMSATAFYNLVRRYPSARWMSITGGEPTLHSDLEGILAIAITHNDIVSINTNGSNPDRIVTAVKETLQWLERSGDNGALGVNVSVEGLADTHDKFTRTTGSLVKVSETLRRLTSINNPNLHIAAEVTLSNYSDHNEAQTLTSLYGIGTTYTIEQKAGYYSNLGRVNGDKPDFPNIHGILTSGHRMGSYLFLRKAGQRRYPSCVAGQYSLFVSPDSVEYPCLFCYPTEPMATFNDQQLEVLRKTCRKCWTPCEAYTTMMFRPWRVL